MIEPLYKRMTPQAAERLKRRCKEYFYYWLKLGEPWLLYSTEVTATYLINTWNIQGVTNGLKIGRNN